MLKNDENLLYPYEHNGLKVVEEETYLNDAWDSLTAAES